MYIACVLSSTATRNGVLIPPRRSAHSLYAATDGWVLSAATRRKPAVWTIYLHFSTDVSNEEARPAFPACGISFFIPINGPVIRF
jgi:hypothetical protein